MKRTNISHTQESGDKDFYIIGGNIFTLRRGGQTFYIGCSGGYDNVNKEMDVSKANKLSAGTRISYLQLAKLNQIEPR